MIETKVKYDHSDLTNMQKKILSVLGEYYFRYGKEGMETTELLDELVKKYGLGKREWQGSLKGLGKKDYVSYGSVHTSCEGAVLWFDKAINYFGNLGD